MTGKELIKKLQELSEEQLNYKVRTWNSEFLSNIVKIYICEKHEYIELETD